MRSPIEKSSVRVSPVHPYQWLWEPLQHDPTFILRPMFGGRSAYLDGKLMLYFAAKTEPWRGVLVCTERAHHGSLLAEFPDLSPHPVLPKWLYLPETADTFERTSARLVSLVLRRDPRFGVAPRAGKKSARRRKHSEPRRRPP